MGNKFYLLILSSILMILIISPNIMGFFSKSHEYMVLKSFQDTHSTITDMCRPYLKIVVDSNTFMDTMILYYFSGDKSTSYLTTHQGFFFKKCLEKAGSDVKKKCACYGGGSHPTQDFFSHNKRGLVPKYLSSQAGLNLVGHMRIEQSAEDKFFEWKKDDAIIKNGILNQYDSTALESFIVEKGGDPELMDFFIDVLDLKDIDVKNTVQIFHTGYTGLSLGFANTVYIDKIKLPFWMWGISIGMIILGLLISITVLFTGKTGWKYITAIFWGFFLVLGIIIVVSFITGTTWQLTTLLLKAPVPYLQVNQEDTEFYYNKAQLATDEFFKTGQLPFDDASGLSYVDSKTGQLVKGALIQAQGTAKIVYMIILPILIFAINIFLFRKTFGLGKKRKR